MKRASYREAVEIAAEVGPRAPLQAAVLFYDQRRADHTERGARQLAELYLRRKLPGICPNQAAVLLANALAERAERRPGGRDNLPTE